MREILFRGKRIDNGEWVEGWYYKRIVHLNTFHQNVVVDAIEVYDGENPLSIAYYSVDPETVGQCTGLTDKNGKKIFEGDIVECWSEGVCARGTVQQNKGGLWIIYPAWQKRIMWGLCPDEYSRTDVEIIGNIHDNPELMK